MHVGFVHGAGRAGRDAWPRQADVAEPGWFFLGREGTADDAVRDSRRLIDWLRVHGGGHLVAHSYGANAVLLAVKQEPALVRSVALLEPACFDLARGEPAVEEHIAAMSPVFAVADDPAVSAREFSARFATAMGVPPPDLPQDALHAAVVRLRALKPPWGVGLGSVARLPVRALVLTSGTEPLYEATARALVASGARQVILSGVGHRTQDHPRANEVLRAFWNERA